MITNLRKRLGLFRRQEDGIAAVEFALFFPVVMGMFIFATEMGLLMTKSVMLEFALDTTIRQLRLGQFENPTSDLLKDTICDRARIIGNCRDTIMIELQPINTDVWALPAAPVSCVDREEVIQPVVAFNMGAQSEIMLVRACVIVEPLFPGTGLGASLDLDADGGYGMAAISAFVNEPS